LTIALPCVNTEAYGEHMHAAMIVKALSIAGAVMLVGLAAVHSILGEHRIFRPLTESGAMPTGFRVRYVHGCWHLASIAWLGLAGALIGSTFAGTGANALVLAAVGTASLVHCVIIGGLSGGRHFGTWGFLIVALLCAGAALG